MSKKSEAELWKELQQGDSQAYTHIYQQYFLSLYNYGMKTIKDKEVVKDCIQNLFVYLWCRRTHLSPVHTIKPYLFKALRRELIRTAKHNSKFEPQQEKHQRYFEIVLSPEFVLIANQMDVEKKACLIRMLNKLTKRQKEVIYLKFYDNLSYQEIASVMDISVEAVYNLMSQSLHLLKDNRIPACFLLILGAPFFFIF